MENNTIEMPKIMNAQDVAEYLGVSKAFAYNLMNSASFPTLRVGKRLLVLAEKFLQWIENHSDNHEVIV